MLWLGLLIAAICGYKPTSFPDLKNGEVLLTGILVASGYALGIMVDRIAREICEFFFDPKRRQGESARNEAEVRETRMENDIKTRSEVLGKEIEYNRSRLRICRSWALNFLFASAAFGIWNSRVTAVPLAKCSIIIAVGCTFSIGMFLVSRMLMVDHSKNLEKSSAYIESQASRESFK